MYFISDHFPRLIEVNSDGKNGNVPSFDPDFGTRGMFRVNNKKIQVSRGRGINVLDYDPKTGNHNFAVHL